MNSRLNLAFLAAFGALSALLAGLAASTVQAGYDPCMNSCSPACVSRVQSLKDFAELHQRNCGTVNQPREKIACKSSSRTPGLWYMQTFPSGMDVGGYFPSQESCVSSRDTRRGDYLCFASASRAGQWYLGRIEKGQADNVRLIGTYFASAQECSESLQQSDLLTICMPSESRAPQWYMLDIATDQVVGSYFNSRSECLGIR
jgi:hypothetical protein